jgi:hypothetical protein
VNDRSCQTRDILHLPKLRLLSPIGMRSCDFVPNMNAPCRESRQPLAQQSNGSLATVADWVGALQCGRWRSYPVDA